MEFRCVFFFKQKTAYEIYQCDWSSDVCSSDLEPIPKKFEPKIWTDEDDPFTQKILIPRGLYTPKKKEQVEQ